MPEPAPLPNTPPAPGAYLQRRRHAAGLSIADVAARLGTEPRTVEHARCQTIQMIEAGVQPATFGSIVALRRVFAFDLAILERLEAIAQGNPLAPPRLCRICSCSDNDPCAVTGPCGLGACWWVAPDLCSACAGTRSEDSATVVLPPPAPES